ncbi:MAG: hypothetical protein EHM87_14950 [Burkholderiales bacterium]|nr:MAG: hypothetical protein EHM87_14950 [Burkholderiales bacterium]
MRVTLNAIGAACLVGLALAAAPPAEARHGHGWRGSVYLGVGPVYRPYWPGYYGAGYYGGYYGGGYYGPYGSPYYGWPYVAPPTVVVAAPPTVYVERADAVPVPSTAPAVAATPPGGYWYWCTESRAYYPSVPTCASSWVAVAPR